MEFRKALQMNIKDVLYYTVGIISGVTVGISLMAVMYAITQTLLLMMY
jgi:hypothetical protein